MSRNDLQQEWLDLSEHWIKETREGRNSNRKGLLDLPMLEACGSVEGLKILECGCGEGRFCRMLVASCAGSGPLTNFHRSLSTYTNDFLNAGFGIVGLVEPTVTAANLNLYPELDDELRVPNFIIYILLKP